MEAALESAMWRTSRNPYRSTIHVMTGPDPSEDDPVIGMMISRELALEAVYRHNQAIHAKLPVIRAVRRRSPMQGETTRAS